MSTAPTPSRGEVWLVDFDPAIGAEIQKVRPALVISLDSIGRERGHSGLFFNGSPQ
jgi:mRNA-degrading endonuclease toxin of MazEF toxin-antitoxin module